MYVTDRLREQYLNGVAEFMRAATEDWLNRGQQYICCPCIDYKKLLNFDNSDQIQEHLIRRGFTERYTRWTSHGEQHMTVVQEEGNEDIVEEERSPLMVTIWKRCCTMQKETVIHRSMRNSRC